MSTKRRTTAEKIAEVQARKQREENELKRLIQQQRAEERKERDRRIYRRGATIESFIDGAGAMTDEQFYKVVANALKRANVQPPAPKAEKIPTPEPAEPEHVAELT